MYDELIKKLRYNSASALQNCEFDFVHDWMLKAADAIEELIKDRDMYVKAMTDEHNRAARLEWDHRWIPVTERLPEEDGRYLALYPLKTKPSVWRHTVYDFAKDLVEVDKFEFNEHKSGFYCYDDEYGYYEDKDVTYWMPLPEPPEMEE